ncbi:YcaO-like family protein [Streptomonospora wellingtoniae]|uniref:YcaO-like family protein n=1 Tax=Streptomonospora wellingtoniae TaxID=3075544 RepID=A0ABU2KWM8_9ACTN|nr:YcaO-like family protein [Streptomonospora sp. DSM 45055]MDT0303709.1 YcaO-like family protein [Streptomonospora sp. DSM 45055]
MPRSDWIAAPVRPAERRADGSAGALEPPWSGVGEREMPVSEAERLVLGDIDGLGWRARHRVLDPDQPTAVQCELRYADGTEVPYGLGAGKGPLDPARTGAHFEALEHALSGPVALEGLRVRCRPADELAEGPFRTDRALGGLSGQPGARLACLDYEPLDGGAPFAAPLYLWAPWYPVSTGGMARRRAALGDTAEYRPLVAYTVNTGCAIGATRDEALLHALNEWVERDAFSLFLLRSVYDRGPMPGRIDPAALSAPLADLLGRARGLVGSDVALLDLTTDLGVPVVMAYARDPADASARHYAMGASLSGRIACERALTEFVQGELLARVVAEHTAGEGASAGQSGAGEGEYPTFDEVVAEHDTAAAVSARLSGHPGLLACARLDFAGRIAECPRVGAPGETVPAGTGVAAQRAEAAARIAAAGYRVGYHVLRRLELGTTLVQVQCPGLERFHQVTNGHLALPGARGRAYRRRGRQPRAAAD